MNQSTINKSIKENTKFIASRIKARRGLEKQMEDETIRKNPARYSKLLRRAAGIGEEIAKAEVKIKDAKTLKSYFGSPYKAEKLPGRNEPCLCGSGKKFKKCCLDKVNQPLRDALVKLGKKQMEKEAA